FQYHFAFLVLSIAMLSLFASGVVYQRIPKPVSRQVTVTTLSTLFWTLLASPLLFDAALPLWLLQSGLIIFGFTVLYCGSFITLHSLRLSERTGPAYAANLFGSALGAVVATGSLLVSSPALGVLALAVLSALIAWRELGGIRRLLGQGCLLVLAGG